MQYKHENRSGSTGANVGGYGEHVDCRYVGGNDHVECTVYNGEAFAGSADKRYQDRKKAGPGESVTCRAGPDYAECWRGSGAVS